MELLEKKSIIAVITTSAQDVGGGAPIFIAKDKEDIQHKIFLLENILDAMAHEIDENTYIMVRH